MVGTIYHDVTAVNRGSCSMHSIMAGAPAEVELCPGVEQRSAALRTAGLAVFRIIMGALLGQSNGKESSYDRRRSSPTVGRGAASGATQSGRHQARSTRSGNRGRVGPGRRRSMAPRCPPPAIVYDSTTGQVGPDEIRLAWCAAVKVVAVGHAASDPSGVRGRGIEAAPARTAEGAENLPRLHLPRRRVAEGFRRSATQRPPAHAAVFTSRD